MSIHVPDHVERLKKLQASRTSQRAWWLSSNTQGTKARLAHQQPSKTEPIMTRTSSNSELKDDLYAALTTCLDTQSPIPPRCGNTQPSLRTSETHPIK